MLQLIITKQKYSMLRNDIVDRNGILLSRNIKAYHVAIKPSLIKDKKKFLVLIKLILPEVDVKVLEKQINKKKYFYLKRGYHTIKGRSFGDWVKKPLFLSHFKLEYILILIFTVT